MKKFLLFAILIGGAATAGAADLEMRVDGKAVSDKYTAYVNESNWLDDGYGMRTFDLEVTPYLTNGGTAVISLSYKAVDVETYDFFGDPETPGMSICTTNYPDNNNCFPLPLEDLVLTVDNADKSFLHFTYTCYADVAMPQIVSSYLLSWKGDANGKLLLTFDSKNASVEAVAEDNAPKRYYNLLGHEVEHPSAGLYIVCQGGKVTKQVVR